jgi:pimeloyl-ACP methyl ester carboxylesterase
MHPAATALAATRLAFDAVEGLTRVIEGMHANIAAGAPPLGRGTDGRTRGVTRFVYTSIRVVNAGARTALDRGLTLVPASGREPDARSSALAALNGVVGDHLAATRNPLAIPMRLRQEGEARRRVLLLIHGLCMNDRQWRWNGHDHGEVLARELDLTPLYLHYNTGRHVSENGRELAELLEAVLAEWSERDAELTILGHSMGGLVARSACHAAAALGHTWPARLRRLIFLGTPHHGAPLERGGNRLETLLGASPYLAPLARLGALRSAGITDLRYGHVREEDWWELDRFTRHGDRREPTPLPPGVECHALAGTRDVLVPVRSALGIHRDPARTLDFPEAQRWVGSGLDHFDLLDHASVYARLREIMSPDAPPRDRRTRAAS